MDRFPHNLNPFKRHRTPKTDSPIRSVSRARPLEREVHRELTAVVGVAEIPNDAELRFKTVSIGLKKLVVRVPDRYDLALSLGRGRADAADCSSPGPLFRRPRKPRNSSPVIGQQVIRSTCQRLRFPGKRGREATYASTDAGGTRIAFRTRTCPRRPRAQSLYTVASHTPSIRATSATDSRRARSFRRLDDSAFVGSKIGAKSLENSSSCCKAMDSLVSTS